MGRRSHSRMLKVWMNGQFVGIWTIPARGSMEFRYDESWVSSPQARPISLSLPIPLDGQPLKGKEVGFFFDNLLPDSQSIRSRLQQRFHTDSQEAFDLLEAIGRDCVGAVQLLPDGKTPEKVFAIEAQRLTDAEVENWLVSAVTPGSAAFSHLADEDNFRISIAGAQEKTAFLWHDGHWCRPLGATPTTHIFKLPLGLVGHMKADMHTSVENEWLCSEIVREFGFPVARCEIGRFGQQKALIVERFDRKMASSGDYWLRLPQEDFCQALGYPSSRKYEADGGPGIASIARLLATSDNAMGDIATFMSSQLAYWMLAATDGHAKNFSIFLQPEGKYRLTPLYDVLSAWPIIGRGPNHLDHKKASMAMSLHGKNRHRRLVSIQRRHFVETAKVCGFANGMNKEIDRLVDRTPAVIEAVGNRLPAGFPMEVFESVTNGLQNAASQLHRAADIQANIKPAPARLGSDGAPFS
ncbi:MAG: type II toxin-antitoxin system HipA family toxin [Azoarcus sp.]|nr:type II toxin-antitoxin system HipA family toxin [Azoarcus sp.]